MKSKVIWLVSLCVLFTLLAFVVLGMTVSQCRPPMFVPDNPYAAKTEGNWTTNCVSVFSYRR